MISGIVINGHATVTIVFRMSEGPDMAIEGVIDTGFTDALCLPPEIVALLKLPFRYEMLANLADNSDVRLPVYAATILWDGEEQEVRVFATGSRPLIGTALLSDYELVVQFTEGGLVTIEKL